jgi:hypothetical protein
VSVETSLRETARLLDRLQQEKTIQGYALIGGLAVSAWGFPRATQDIDFLVSIPPPSTLKAFRKGLEEHGFPTKAVHGAPADPVPCVVRASRGGIPIDMLVVTRKWEEEAVQAAVSVQLGEARIPVVTPEYLIAMKLKAGGPRDLLDARELLSMSEVDMESLRDLARRLRVDRRLDRLRRPKL